ncbi:MAG TPA: hydroxyethylthiazole kinase, partial [Acidimicrobiales bacterium]|nr:hydroxyethylthiazole kinase [Acidimicrobiales bacterium]
RGDPTVVATLGAVAGSAPLVHCITNIVVAGFTANVLLAIGASPAMVENAAESADFAATADALLVNLGTLSEERERAVRAAAQSARGAGTSWVLDPVGVGALAHRRELAGELLECGPAVVRGNASEVMSLAGVRDSRARGVDSLSTGDDAAPAALELARRTGAVVAVSGQVDLVTDGERVVRIAGGDVLMTEVTGVGCALGAVMAACVAVARPMESAVAASVLFAAAAERAAAGTPGPGTFAVRLIDVLAELVSSTAGR